MVEEFLYAIKSKLGLGPKSQKWKHWVAQLDLKTCTQCRTMHGKIYSVSESVPNMPPLHWYCRCEIKPMNTIARGECSKAGQNGADWWLMHHNVLPDAPGRIWYEADLNYYSGKRNSHRLLWSSDGLFFVTYDHYESFIEVIGG